MTAEDCKIFKLRKLAHPLLSQRLSLGRHIDKVNLFAHLFAKSLIAVIYRLSAHYHAHSASVGSVVNPAVLIGRIVAYLAAVDFNKVFPPRPADNAFGKHAFAHFRKKGKNINPHRQKSP